MNPTCPLCGNPESPQRREGPGKRTLLLCGRCNLLFAPPEEHPGPEAEKARYLQHRNHLEDDGYRRFLMRLAEPVSRYLLPGARGLDFGCGPTESLSRLMTDGGWSCERFDPLFAPQIPSQTPFDFLLASECLEHMHCPLEGWLQMLAWTRPGGILGLMTERWTPRKDPATWAYARDRTHVTFYSTETLYHLARRWGLIVREDDGERVMVLERTCTPVKG